MFAKQACWLVLALYLSVYLSVSVCPFLSRSERHRRFGNMSKTAARRTRRFPVSYRGEKDKKKRIGETGRVMTCGRILKPGGTGSTRLTHI